MKMVILHEIKMPFGTCPTHFTHLVTFLNMFLVVALGIPLAGVMFRFQALRISLAGKAQARKCPCSLTGL